MTSNDVLYIILFAEFLKEIISNTTRRSLQISGNQIQRGFVGSLDKEAYPEALAESFAESFVAIGICSPQAIVDMSGIETKFVSFFD